MTENTDLAQKFFAASSSGDIATMNAMSGDDVSVRQNSGPALGFAAIAGLAKAVRRVAPDFRYEDAVKADTGTGFVEEHDVCGTFADGTTFRVSVCVVATVSDGRIATMHEYLDTAEAQPLMAALARPAN